MPNDINQVGLAYLSNSPNASTHLQQICILMRLFAEFRKDDINKP